MNKHQHQESESTLTMRSWTYKQAMSVVPYLSGLMRSLREQWLEIQRARLEVHRLDARPGRADRHALILRAEAAGQVDRAQNGFRETLHELNALDIVCLDALQGLAVIPFVLGDEQAWFVFDLFAAKGVEAWLFDADPPDTRRALRGDGGLASWSSLPTAAVDHVMSHGKAATGDWSAAFGGL
jgi:hypothetical protein